MFRRRPADRLRYRGYLYEESRLNDFIAFGRTHVPVPLLMACLIMALLPVTTGSNTARSSKSFEESLEHDVNNLTVCRTLSMAVMGMMFIIMLMSWVIHPVSIIADLRDKNIDLQTRAWNCTCGGMQRVPGQNAFVPVHAQANSASALPGSTFDPLASEAPGSTFDPRIRSLGDGCDSEEEDSKTK